MIVAFKISPILLHTLGNDAYGAWEILLSVQSYLILLDLGIIPAIVRFVARAAAQDVRVQLNRILTTTLFFLTLVGLAGFLVMGVVAAFPDRVLNLHSAHIDGVRVAAILLGVNLLIQFPAQVFVSFLMGMQRHYFLNALRVVLAITGGSDRQFSLRPHPWPGASLVWLALFTAGSTFPKAGRADLAQVPRDEPAIGRRHFSRPP
jgi:O-antigen/teichoic acid export membrane protein